MPQQINLCTPILLTQKRYFSAQNMVQALAVFVVLGGGLCAYWIWSLNVASEGFKKTVSTQGQELESLQAAIRQSKAGLGPVESALAKELQAARNELLQRERLYDELQRGLFQPGRGHSARLQLIAQSIPASVWVTEINTDANQLEVSGFTLEPAALNDWVRKLGASPLLQGQKLSTVRVESTSAASTKTVPGATAVTPALSAASSAAPGRAAPPMWSFRLTSAVADPSSAGGGKP
ncbi:MAG: PilN domain-containing protein [Rhodoferax sp.]|nr:PilN domain-containing protein [Rhodoferax sp.]